VTAREDILGRIGAALGDVPADELPDDVIVERGYGRSLGLDVDKRHRPQVSPHRGPHACCPGADRLSAPLLATAPARAEAKAGNPPASE
jgi:hypothetical protein